MKKYYNKNTGYISVYIDGAVVGEHRYKVETKIGRKLLKTEVVHHINGDKTDNRLKNLKLLTTTEHARLHLKKDRIRVICKECGSGFFLMPHIHMARKRRNKNGLFCSRSCGTVFQFKKK